MQQGGGHLLFLLERGDANGRWLRSCDLQRSASLTEQMLERYSVIDAERNRQYLLGQTQHLVGGFGKIAGDPPGKATSIEWQLHADTTSDLLHSYFGMVSMAFQGEAGLHRVDPTLVTTERVVQHLESLPWRV